MFFAFTELNVTLSAIYTPAPGGNSEKLGSNEYLAGSALLLNCTVEGNSSSLMYKWSVMENLPTPDCSEMKCNIDTSSTTSVHSNSPYPGSLGPGTVRNSEMPVTKNFV